MEFLMAKSKLTNASKSPEEAPKESLLKEIKSGREITRNRQ